MNSYGGASTFLGSSMARMKQEVLAALRIGAAPIKRAFLYALVGAVGVSALLAITAIVSGAFGDLEFRILLSTVTIAAASVCGLACGACLEPARNRTLPLFGIALALAAAAASLLLIWTESWREVDVALRTTASLGVFAVAVAHLCLLSMAKLAARFEWSLVVAHVVILFVAALVTVMIWFEVSDEESAFQLLAVAVILDAAITILIPIFHRLSCAH